MSYYGYDPYNSAERFERGRLDPIMDFSPSQQLQLLIRAALDTQKTAQLSLPERFE